MDNLHRTGRFRFGSNNFGSRIRIIANSRIQDRSIRFFLPVAFVVFFSQLVVLSDSENVNFTLVKNAELGSRQCYSFATSKMRQRNRASRTNKKIDKFLGPGARWSSHTKNSTGTVNSSITNNFVACKHGHVVAAVVWKNANSIFICFVSLKFFFISIKFTKVYI